MITPSVAEMRHNNHTVFLIAPRVTDPVHKLALVDIAQRWLRLAAQIDAIHASRNPEVPATQVRSALARPAFPKATMA